MLARTVAVLALLLAASSSAVVRAQDVSNRRLSLSGVQAVRVIVEDVSPDLSQIGVSRDVIQTQVELRLRTLGINVVDPSIPGGYLYVAVAALTEQTGTAAFIVKCEYRQNVALQRQPSILVYGAPTWMASSGVHTVGSNLLANSIIATVARKVDEFANDYLAANPPRR